MDSDRKLGCQSPIPINSLLKLDIYKAVFLYINKPVDFKFIIYWSRFYDK